jgi:hypothetical protein
MHAVVVTYSYVNEHIVFELSKYCDENLRFRHFFMMCFRCTHNFCVCPVFLENPLIKSRHELFVTKEPQITNAPFLLTPNHKICCQTTHSAAIALPNDA